MFSGGLRFQRSLGPAPLPFLPPLPVKPVPVGAGLESFGINVPVGIGLEPPVGFTSLGLRVGIDPVNNGFGCLSPPFNCLPPYPWLFIACDPDGGTGLDPVGGAGLLPVGSGWSVPVGSC